MSAPPVQVVWQAEPARGEIRRNAVRRALRTFLDALGFAASGVSVLVADDAALRALNAEYRGRDRPTDVLSWSYREPDDPAPPPLLGELAVSLERVRAQARDNGWDAHTELLRLLAHGCAHLAGYDHATAPQEREMRAVEIRLLRRVDLSGLYPDEDAAP